MEFEGHVHVSPGEYLCSVVGNRKVLTFAQGPSWLVTKTNKVGQSVMCGLALAWMFWFGLHYANESASSREGRYFLVFALTLFSALPIYGLWAVWLRWKAERLLEVYIKSNIRKKVL